MIRSWVFEFFPELGKAEAASNPDAVSDYFAAYLDLWAQDEALGFEGIFFSEHHFGGAFSPSPHLLIAAVAQRTQTLRLGVMGVVTPYYRPWRIAEEVGMLDHMTRGRLEIGTAIGIPPELASVKIEADEARGRNEEAIDILHAALRDETVSYRGPYTQFDNLRLLPPARAGAPERVWTTVVSQDSAVKAARRRSKICTGFNPTPKIKAVFDAYRAAAADDGFDVGPDHVALRRRIALAETEGEARERLQGVSERLRAMLAKDPRAALKQVPDAPEKSSGFTLGEDEFISGTPPQVAEQIIAQCRAVGAANFLAVLHWGAGYDEVSQAHKLFGAKVIPELRRAAL